MGTYTQKVRNSGLWVASETGWPLQKTWGKRLLSPYRATVSVMSLVKRYRQISGRKRMPRETMWEITKWPFHVQDLNDKLKLMPWLKPCSKQPGFSVSPFTKERLPLLRLTNTACESFTQISCCWKLLGLFLDAASVRRQRFIVNREKPVAFFSRCHDPWHRLNGRVKTKSTRTTKRGWVEETRHRQKKTEGRQEKGHITVSKTKTPKNTVCQCPCSWKIHPYMKAKAFSLLSWSAKREVRHNIHLNSERPI